jgi:hypothetical protein
MDEKEIRTDMKPILKEDFHIIRIKNSQESIFECLALHLNKEEKDITNLIKENLTEN